MLGVGKMTDNNERKVRCVILEDGWIVCGVCGKKLAKINVQITENETRRLGRTMTFKCHVCKSIATLEL